MSRHRAPALVTAAVALALLAAALLVPTRASAGADCWYGEITLGSRPVLSAPAPAHPGDTITSTGGAWSACGGVPFTGFYKEWLRDGQVVSGPEWVDGPPDSFTYTIEDSDAGHELRSAVAACNDEYGCFAPPAQSSNSVVPTNDAPPTCDPEVEPQCGWLMGESGDDDEGVASGCLPGDGGPSYPCTDSASRLRCEDIFPNECFCPRGSAWGGWFVRGILYRAGQWPFLEKAWKYDEALIVCSDGYFLNKLRRARWHQMIHPGPWEWKGNVGSSCIWEDCRDQLYNNDGSRRHEVTVTTTGWFKACVGVPHGTVCQEKQPMLYMAADGSRPSIRFWWRYI